MGEKESISHVCWRWINLNPWIKMFFCLILDKKNLIQQPLDKDSINPPTSKMGGDTSIVMQSVHPSKFRFWLSAQNLSSLRVIKLKFHTGLFDQSAWLGLVFRSS